MNSLGLCLSWLGRQRFLPIGVMSLVFIGAGCQNSFVCLMLRSIVILGFIVRFCLTLFIIPSISHYSYAFNRPHD